MQALNLIFFYGKGGVGKDTQAELMVREHPDWRIISTGDRIKQALYNSEDEFHPIVAPYLDLVHQGKNLPMEVVINPANPERSIFPSFVAEQIRDGATTLLSTGFPRTPRQLYALDQYLKGLEEQFQVTQEHIFLDVEDTTILERVGRRRRQYKERGLKPRHDDEPEIVQQRFETFDKDTLPLINMLFADGRLIRISAEGTPDQVNNLVREALEHRPALGIIKLPEGFVPALGRERDY